MMMSFCALQAHQPQLQPHVENDIRPVVSLIGNSEKIAKQNINPLLSKNIKKYEKSWIVWIDSEIKDNGLLSKIIPKYIKNKIDMKAQEIDKKRQNIEELFKSESLSLMGPSEAEKIAKKHIDDQFRKNIKKYEKSRTVWIDSKIKNNGLLSKIIPLSIKTKITTKAQKINQKYLHLQGIISNSSLSNDHRQIINSYISEYDLRNRQKLIDSPTYCFKLLFFRDNAMHSFASKILGGFNERVKDIERKISEENNNLSNNRSLTEGELVKKYVTLVQNL